MELSLAILVGLISALTIAQAQTPTLAPGLTHPASVLQLYSYRPSDPAKFRDGYRAHLDWHVKRHDVLVWYAWSVQAGPRRGLFIDGTAGASFAELDARPDLPGDGADFAATAGPYAQAVDVETWELWQEPSTANPLEDRKPGAVVDAFLLEVLPAQTARRTDATSTRRSYPADMVP
jgi:hypothetical protein